MEYTKLPLTIDQQIAKLKDRGLRFVSEDSARKYLLSISYYRLRAYTYPFQDNSDVDTPFNVDVSFEEIIKLYGFDHKLRCLVFEMLGIIEVAFRTQIIYRYSLVYGSHWHLNPSIFRSADKYNSHIESLKDEVGRSNETFIAHYKNKYNTPVEPACWMSLEVSSFGLLSKFFQNLRKGEEKIQITEYFGLNKVDLLENWLFCFSNLRNICAHHSRLWNRRLTAIPQFPTRPKYVFIHNLDGIYPNKLYGTLSCMLYVLNIVRPDNSFAMRIRDLIQKFPRSEWKEMGFPDNWREEVVWMK